jgi:glycosyltransferase involved in cell wall biosynthesis
MNTIPTYGPNEASCLIITGMHRSGTSILASFLRAAGVDLGESSLPADGASPLGSCGDRDDIKVRELQREMLVACTMAEGGWRDWGWTETQRLDFSQLTSFRPEAEALVRRRNGATRPWGWNDPGTTILLDFWDEILSDARYIFIYRPAWEVATSLAALHRSPFLEHPEFVPRIWRFYNRHLLDFYRRHQDRCLLVELESLLSRPREVLARIRSKLGLHLEEPQDGAAILRRACGEESLGATGSTASLRRLSAKLYPSEAQLWGELERVADLPAGRDLAAEPAAELFGTSSSAQDRPTFTVVIPCFNQGEFVLAAVASGEASSGVDGELVIVNDGSTDPFTIEILERLRAAGYRILDQPNRGLSAARNAGIRASQGRYILALDADNRIRPAYLRRAAEILDAAPEVGVVYGDIALFGARSGPWRVPEFNLNELAAGNRIDAGAVFRREVWEQCGGYDEDMKVGWEDWDFWLSVAETGWKFAYVPEMLFEYRVQSNSLSSGLSKPENRRRALEFITTKHATIFQPRLPKMFAEKDAHWLQAEERATLLDRSLEEVRGDLETARRDLQAIRDDLQSTRSELDAARSELRATRSELFRFVERIEFMTGTRAWRLRAGLLRLRAAFGLRWRP